MKRCYTAHVIREIQTKTRYHYQSVRRAKIWTLTTANDDKVVEQQEHSHTAGRNAKWYRHTGR